MSTAADHVVVQAEVEDDGRMKTGASDTIMLSHISSDTRRSPLPNEVNDSTGYVDPYEGESAKRRNDSVKGRPLSTVENIDSGTARPPSFIEVVPFPVRNPHMEPVKIASEGGRSRHYRRRSLDSGHILRDESHSHDQKPIKKARSADNMLAAFSSESAATANPESTKAQSIPDNERNHLHMIQFLPFSDKSETPDVSPVLAGCVNPIQATDTTNVQYPYSVKGSTVSFYSALSRDEFRFQMNDFKQEQQDQFEAFKHTVNQRLGTLENAVFNITKREIAIPHIESSLRIIKDKKIAAGSVINTPPFYTRDIWGGYRMCMRVYLNGDGKGKGACLSVFLVIMKGKHDSKVEIVWPFNQKVTFILVNPTDGGEDITASISTEPKMRAKDPAFQQPKTETNRPIGFPCFVSHKKLYSRGFVQNDSITLRMVVETEYINPQPQLPEHCSEK